MGFVADEQLEIWVTAHNMTTAGLAAAGAEMELLNGRAQKLTSALNVGGIGGAGTMGSLLGLGGFAAVAGIAIITKAIIDQYDKHEQAVLQLRQAYDQASLLTDMWVGEIEKWIATNKRFIGDVNEARDSFGLFTRAIRDQEMVFKAMNVALDLSALKHISLKDASELVLKALEGQGRGLVDLGIKIKDYGLTEEATSVSSKHLEEATKKVDTANRELAAAMQREKDLHDALSIKKKITIVDLDHWREAQDKVKTASANLKTAQEDLAAVQTSVNTITIRQGQLLDDLGGKVKGGRQATTELSGSWNQLKATWDAFATYTGPAFAKAMSLALDVVTRNVQDLLSQLQAVVSAIQWIINNASKALSAGAGQGFGGSGSPPPGRHHSGVEFTGSGLWSGTVMAGERIVGPNGGGGGGGTMIAIDLRGSVLASDQAMDDLARKIGRIFVAQSGMHTAVRR